jgi:hypothetical protein
MIEPNAGTGEPECVLAADELESVAGGRLPFYAAAHLWVRPLDRVALNPQPLPPRQSLALRW